VASAVAAADLRTGDGDRRHGHLRTLAEASATLAFASSRMHPWLMASGASAVSAAESRKERRLGEIWVSHRPAAADSPWSESDLGGAAQLAQS